MGFNFIPRENIPGGRDEYYIRNKQTDRPEAEWRLLHPDEIQQLIENNNTADNWHNIRVTEVFDPGLIRNSRFYGLVRIGSLRNVVLQHHNLKLCSGISNSLIISSDIGDDVAIHHVHYLSHVIIGNRNILSHVGTMSTTSHARFGNGIIKDGQQEQTRLWMDVMNEAGTRRILPFDGIITADAYLWAKYRDDAGLQQNLLKITQNTFDSRPGYYSITGEACVILDSLILKDVKIGANCCIEGATTLENLTINSSADEPTRIGGSVELVNGILGVGCQVLSGSKATHFILGSNVSLRYGARLIHSFLGDNSTVSCCEVLNNLIFPAHEQHHNNSFLIATVVMGQSNIAAGATIGSNHNSRSNDNEIQAGRGFWPGLCTSLKHSCRFASYTLLSKADYTAELDIPLPFSLLNNNISEDRLEIIPAYWWRYNMYALARNTWKYNDRDKRIHQSQHIEFDAFAPDTMEEVINALRLLEIWTAKAWLPQQGKPVSSTSESDFAKQGRTLLISDERTVHSLEVLGENMEHAKRKTLIVKPYQAYHAYRDMLLYYAVNNVMQYLCENPGVGLEQLHHDLKGERKTNWINLGGQIMPGEEFDKLRKKIASGKLNSWNDIHEQYDYLWEQYKIEKQRHAYATLLFLLGTDSVTAADLKNAINTGVTIRQFVSDQVYTSRKKDYDNPFRLVTYRNAEEMEAAMGTIENNSFVARVREETASFKKQAGEIMNRL